MVQKSPWDFDSAWISFHSAIRSPTHSNKQYKLNRRQEKHFTMRLASIVLAVVATCSLFVSSDASDSAHVVTKIFTITSGKTDNTFEGAYVRSGGKSFTIPNLRVAKKREVWVTPLRRSRTRSPRRLCRRPSRKTSRHPSNPGTPSSFQGGRVSPIGIVLTATYRKARRSAD